MKAKGIVIAGLILIVISQLLMAFGYDFLMAQRPIDFAHWTLLIGALAMVGLWSTLPDNATKSIGLTIMTLGIGGIVGMCLIDFMLWAAHDQPDLKQQLFGLIFGTPSIQVPFLMIGPAMFYSGICIATYGLFNRFRWQVISVNVGALMVGLGHMILHNQVVPAIGAILLLVGILSVLNVPTPEVVEQH